MVYAGSAYPAGLINIRSTSGNQYTIVDDSRGGTVLGTAEEARVWETLHPGAVYLHMGEAYVVETLDPTNFRAHVRPAQGNYYTEPRTESHIEILETRRRRKSGANTVAYFGTVVVTTQVVGFKQKQFFSDEVLGDYDLDLPEQRFRDRGRLVPGSDGDRAGRSPVKTWTSRAASMPSNTRRSGCCRFSRSVTATTSAAFRPPTIRRSARPPSSSTMPTPAASASPRPAFA